ncbi:hypothetical protein BGX20_009916, partial [Mortierella sp. AD010]
QQARARRIVKDQIRIVNLHEAEECVNPECPSFLVGYTIKSRDQHAAAAIAIIGPRRPYHPISRLSLHSPEPSLTVPPLRTPASRWIEIPTLKIHMLIPWERPSVRGL